MTRKIAVADIAGVAEVAYALDVGVAAVSQWIIRHPGMPDPVRMLAATPVWDLGEVVEWYRRWKNLPDTWQPRA